MANIDFYRRHLGIKNHDELEKYFFDTLVQTNHTYSFFVDWDKVIRNRDVFRNELALLSSLKGVSNPADYLRKLINRYPEVVRVFPLLLAKRERVLKVLHALKPDVQYVMYDFGKRKRSDNEVRILVDFCEKTGLLKMLSSMDSTIDYMTGIEVGLDSNARKNRSGDFMEDAIDEALTEIISRNKSFRRVSQQKFAYLQSECGVNIAAGLADRIFDEAVFSGNFGISIETNFYNTTGSKLNEIAQSYSLMEQQLDSMGWELVWITDGRGWIDTERPFRRGIEKIHYVFNLHMVAEGLLEKLILEGKR
jgi:type II restriction enzyme